MIHAVVFLLIYTFLGYVFSDYIIVKKARKFHSVGRSKRGYHIHHSMYGVLSFLLAPFTVHSLFLIGFGLGIIIEHTLTERFVFIEKEKHDV